MQPAFPNLQVLSEPLAVAARVSIPIVAIPQPPQRLGMPVSLIPRNELQGNRLSPHQDSFLGDPSFSYLSVYPQKVDSQAILLLTCPLNGRTISRMNKTSTEDRVRVLACLVEGNSVNSTVRMTGIAKTTILRLIEQLGTACKAHHDETVRNLKASRIQVDEIWSFCYAKEKNVPQEKRGQFGFGDVWTWTAIDADSKLMVAYLVGQRDLGYATEFMQDVASRLTDRVQLTSDGFTAYDLAVPDAFGGNVDFAMLVKSYGKPAGYFHGKHVPDVCISCTKKARIGNPDEKHISTSFAERANLSMRMGMRRFTRLTNGHSKKIENHIHMQAIFFAHYNFCRIHSTTKLTPAMSAGLTTKLWEIEDLLELIK
jgi:IS1 family transposase